MMKIKSEQNLQRSGDDLLITEEVTKDYEGLEKINPYNRRRVDFKTYIHVEHDPDDPNKGIKSVRVNNSGEETYFSVRRLLNTPAYAGGENGQLYQSLRVGQIKNYWENNEHSLHDLLDPQKGDELMKKLNK